MKMGEGYWCGGGALDNWDRSVFGLGAVPNASRSMPPADAAAVAADSPTTNCVGASRNRDKRAPVGSRLAVNLCSRRHCCKSAAAASRSSRDSASAPAFRRLCRLQRRQSAILRALPAWVPPNDAAVATAVDNLLDGTAVAVDIVVAVAAGDWDGPENKHDFDLQ